MDAGIKMVKINSRSPESSLNKNTTVETSQLFRCYYYQCFSERSHITELTLKMLRKPTAIQNIPNIPYVCAV